MTVLRLDMIIHSSREALHFSLMKNEAKNHVKINPATPAIPTRDFVGFRRAAIG
jgi:hypothetical protein